MRPGWPRDRVGRSAVVGSSCSLRCWWLDDAVDGAGEPRYPASAAGRDRVAEARPVVAVGQLGVRERWGLGVAAAHVRREAADAVSVVPFDAESFARDEPVGALAGAGRLDIGGLLAGLPAAGEHNGAIDGRPLLAVDVRGVSETKGLHVLTREPNDTV